jgi:DNA-binding transcriptional ArsR family regulator
MFGVRGARFRRCGVCMQPEHRDHGRVEDPVSLPAGLVTLLGTQRALILRRLGHPLTAGELAEALAAGPSTASYHLSALERAGLVDRERRGRHILVRRTPRGTQLLDLYEAL